MEILLSKFTPELFRRVLEIYQDIFLGNKFLTKCLGDPDELASLTQLIIAGKDYYQIPFGSKYDYYNSRLIVDCSDPNKIRFAADPNLSPDNIQNDDADKDAELFNNKISDLERELNL